MDTLYSMLTLALIFSTPIIIAGLGGLFSERSGVTNIALEGLMMFGAFTGATVTVLLEPYFVGELNIAPFIGIIFGSLAGALVSIIHAYLSINLNADQVISGTGINLLATGATIYMAEIIFNQQRTDTFQRGFIKTTVPGLSEIPVIGEIFFTSIYLTVFVGFALVFITWYVVYKTRFGLRLRSTGENPHASDSMGINVTKMRYTGVILSGEADVVNGSRYLNGNGKSTPAYRRLGQAVLDKATNLNRQQRPWQNYHQNHHQKQKHFHFF